MKYLAQFILLILYAGASPAQQSDWLDYRGILELQAFSNNSSKSWYSGGFAKLRYDQDSFPLQLGKAGLHLDAHLSDTLWLRTLGTAYTDPKLDPNLIEAYLHYRPVPHGPLRIRARVGAFQLPLSAENKGVAWSSLYSTTPSVINSWVGEEVRVIGSELELAWPGRARQSAHDFSVTAGLYGFNDGITTLIAYRGWAANDRLTGIGDKLRLIPESPGQVRQFNPMREIDDRVGYYIAGSWVYQQWLELNLLHYNNRAEPTAIRNRQIAWNTEFDHVSLQLNLPQDVKLIGQYIKGASFIDNKVTGFSSDINYSAWYVMFTRLIDKHRLSLRYENFNVEDNDRFKFSVHNSDETGHGSLCSTCLKQRNNLTQFLVSLTH